jgi:hypothetical protein
MSVPLLAQYLNFALAIVLVIRLYRLKLISQYKIFSALIVFDIVTSAVAMFVPWNRLHLDYRVAWLASKPISWILYIAVVFSVLQRVMFGHKGILSMSRKVFGACFIVSVLLGLISARIEFVVAHPNAPVELAFIVDRAFCTVSLLLLCATLVYLLWFPVAVSRNAALLCAGLMVYFAVKTALMLVRDIWSPNSVKLVSLALVLLFTACLTFWVLFFTEAGEYETVRPGHSWKPKEQDRLLNQLEAINAVLLRSAKQ